MSLYWTAEREARLTDLWNAGLPASQIAKALGDGLSRNAVIGKAHRLKLPSRAQPARNQRISAIRHPEMRASASLEGRRPSSDVHPSRPPSAAPQDDGPARRGKRQFIRALEERSRAAVKPRRAMAEPDQVEAYVYVPAQPPPYDLATPPMQRRTLLELSDHACRWPIGEPGADDFFFCGAVPLPDKPYCATHCARAYEPELEESDAERRRKAA